MTEPQGPQQPATVDLTSAAPAATAKALPPGQLIGDYELLEEVARGGMGVVYKARDRRSGLLVALKMMLGDRLTDEADLRRFGLEARALGELNHPGVVSVHSWGQHENHPFYTMDFVPGVTLASLLQNGPLPPERAVRYLLGIARAVAAAHGLGIVHRDLKPGNVIIDPADQPRVLDFGLAKRQAHPDIPGGEVPLDAIPADAPPTVPAPDPRGHTEVGAILGTPAYMAPEQVRAAHDEIGPPSDVHALGAIFYEMLTGKPPFQGQQTYDTLMQVLRQDPVPVRTLAPDVPLGLEAVCRRCLAKDRRKRYPDAAALAVDLEERWQHLTGGRVARRRAALSLLVFLVLLPVSWSLGAWLGGDLVTLAQWAVTRTLPARAVGEALLLLAGLLQTTVFVATPLFAAVGFVAWLTAWGWLSGRHWPIAGGMLILAAASVLLWLVDNGAFDSSGLWLVACVAQLAAVTTFIAACWRTIAGADRVDGEGIAPHAEPYLRKLFATRTDARPKGTLRPSDALPGLADFEMGKTLYNGDVCVVRWAKQKSLDRPVLVWLEQKGKTETAPGVVVRHPDVLPLHAAGTHPGGRYFVTEATPGTPLAGLVLQRPFTTSAAVHLVARMAQAVQAFHDQGACHGQLSAEWLLVHGDMEPLLCPCGAPARMEEERQEDVVALGRLLQEWLPRHAPNAARRIADTAQAGGYARPQDLADALERFGKASRWLSSQVWANVAVVLVLLLPLVVPLLSWVQERVFGQKPSTTPTLLVSALVLVLGSAAGVAGCRVAQGAIRRLRQGERVGGGRRVFWGLLLVVGCWLAACVMALPGLAGTEGVGGTVLLLGALFAGFALLGAWLAGLFAFAEEMFLRYEQVGQ